MVKGAKYKCLVCGRTFYEGQGIVIRRGDLELAFHSARCAAKFLRLLVERAEGDCIKSSSIRLSKELEEALSKRLEAKKKVIA
ncbi:MAG: hypothetical protein RXN29_01840 [Acidilobus sp.]|nr:hypothetical protein [Acidilobus sp.]MCG2889386.1 hypothetical protein [Acidilobus sp.]MCG2890937.1 hypothetical protein [Acidilobus sp.]NAZ31367.1 hypothetical protein [Acidilobus sp.]